MLRRRTLLSAAAAASLLAAAGGTAVASGVVGGSAASPIDAAQAPTTAVQKVDPALERAFALLRTRTATPVPDALVDQFASPARYGRNPALARQIETVTGTGWVIPGNGYLCIAIPDPVDGYGSTCSRTEDVLRRGLYIGLRGGKVPDGQAAQTILAPDGAAVKVVGDDGAAAPRLEAKAGSPVEVASNGVFSGLVAADSAVVVDAP